MPHIVTTLTSTGPVYIYIYTSCPKNQYFFSRYNFFVVLKVTKKIEIILLTVRGAPECYLRKNLHNAPYSETCWAT